jgi:LAO/AO transport system kinase
MWTMLEQRLMQRLRADAELQGRLPAIEAAVAEGKLSPGMAVEELAAALGF